MDQAKPPKADDDNSPEQKRDERSGIGMLVGMLIVVFIYVAYDRGWKVTFNSGEAGYCRDVRQKISELCAGTDHDACKHWQEALAKCQSDNR
jgi:hypothetical protein